MSTQYQMSGSPARLLCAISNLIQQSFRDTNFISLLLCTAILLSLCGWDNALQAQTSTIGDFVWIDSDGDGIQDAGEPGLEGVTIELYNDANEDGVPDGSPVAVTTSSPDGHYQLSGISYGSYVLKFKRPIGYDYTSQDAGEDIRDNDADPNTGLTSTFTIGESMWVEILDITNDGSIWGEVTWDYHTSNGEGEYLFVDITGDGLDSVVVKGGPSENVYYESPYTDLHAPPKHNGGYHGISHLEFYFKYVDVTGLDVGFVPIPLVKGNIWFDYDEDGLIDLASTSEYTLDQWTVNLLDDNGNIIETTTAAADGSYYFEDFGTGTYSVEVVSPDGYQSTFDPDGSGTSGSSTFTISSGEHIDSYNFGYTGTAAAGEFIWEDDDQDGIFDPNESGLSGWTIEIESDEGSFSTTLNTDSDGHYIFDNLAPGTYTISVTPSPDYVQTYDENGTETENQNSISLDPDDSYMTSDFGYISSEALPVKWLFFTAEFNQNKDRVHLQWKTIEDIHTDQYTIQRSNDGMIWNNLGTMKAKSARNAEQSYNWVDSNPLPGDNYYRIRQTDIDGAFSQSEVRLVRRSIERNIRIYPNPASSILHVIIPEEIELMEISMHNFSGREIKKYKQGGALDIRNISPGLYMVLVRDDSGRIITEKKVLIKR